MDNETGNDTKNTPVQQAENADNAQAQNGNETVVGSRRRLTGATLAAPIVMSLTSRSVWGAHGDPTQCLSAMMSGDLSHAHEEQCRTGWSPGGWMNLGGTIDMYTSETAWVMSTGAGLLDDAYGEVDPSDKCNSKPNGCQNCSEYLPGTGFTFVDAFGVGTGMTYKKHPQDTVVYPMETLREVLCYDNGSDAWHATAAWLNAGVVVDYPLTQMQVADLYNGAAPPPGFSSAREYFESLY